MPSINRIPLAKRIEWAGRRFMREEGGALLIPQKGIKREEASHSAPAANYGVAVTTSGTASVKGTAVELIASTAFDAYGMIVTAGGYGAAATASQGAMDILIGAATEEVLIANLLMGYCGTFATVAGKGHKQWFFPIYIPAGTRIAAQAAGARTTTAFRVGVFLFGGDGCPPWRCGSKVTTYGMGTVPDGTAITPGASGAAGSWTQIAASTNEDHFAFCPSFQLTGDTTTNLRGINVDIGIGAATEEQIGISRCYGTDSGETMDGMWPNWPIFADVPSGTRLVMRASNHGANDGGYNGVIHAVS